MKVSVIVPIYNAEMYIAGLIHKFRNQTYNDFEVIFVNDGSTDNSKKILSAAISDDPCFKIISQENKGICAARNAGIMAANGVFLIFLDQDDEFDFDLVRCYVEEIEKSDVDMSIFGTNRLYLIENDVKQRIPQIFESESVFTKKIKFQYLFNIDNRKRLSTVWNCIYKRELIEKYSIRFDTHFRHGDEDGLFNIEYVSCCNSMSFSDEIHYSYMLRQGVSTISKYNSALVEDYIYFIEKVSGIMRDECDASIIDMMNLYFLRFFSNVYMRLCRNKGVGISSKKLLLERLHENKTFLYATKYSTWSTKLKVPKMYYFWDVFNFFFIRKYYYVSIKMLDYLMRKKKKVSVIKQ